MIGLSHIIIGICACYIGVQLNKNNILIPVQVFWFLLMLFFAISILHQQLYPARLSFFRKKLFYLVILLTGFIMTITTSNRPDTNHLSMYSTLQGSFAEKKESVPVPVTKLTGKEVRKHLKELKKEMRATGASGGAIAISVVVGLILIVLVASLACTLACNNQGALAIIVLLGGLAGVFFIMKAIIRSSTRRRNEVQVPPQEPAIE
jgi:Ca2+/Na+ antiporter